MTTLIALGSIVVLLGAVTGRPYPQSWYARWSRHS